MEEYKELAESLNKNKDGIPRARRFRDNLTKIELILATGIRIRYLVDCLNKHNFEITIKAFKEELHKSRKHFKKPSITNEQQNIVAPEITTSKCEDLANEDKKGDTPKQQEQTAVPRRKTLKEVREEFNKMMADDKRPLY